MRLLADLAPDRVELFAVTPRPEFVPAEAGVLIHALARHLAVR